MKDETPTSLTKQPGFVLVMCLIACLLVGFVGSQASMAGLQGWYQALNKPAYGPPAWLFAPVWTLLYILMGVALFQVWQAKTSNSRGAALGAFFFQLFLNGIWSWIFFAWHKLSIAFFDMVVLDLAIVATIFIFRKVRRSAAWLMAPYLAWCCFATMLCFSIWKLNPTGTNPADQSIRVDLGTQ
jgi:benzodiazapine receptor